MKKEYFIKQYFQFARETQKKSGISAIAILAQAAHESAWGEAAPGNMFFGVKDSDGVNGNEQLLTTTEYSRRSDLKFPEIISIDPVVILGKKMFKYRVKDYFRAYKTPEECFTDHAEFFKKNKRYKTALYCRENPVEFLREVAKAGYATDPKYFDLLKKMIADIQDISNRLGLLNKAIKRYVFNTYTGNLLEYKESLSFDFTKGNLIDIWAVDKDDADKQANNINCCCNCAATDVCLVDDFCELLKNYCKDFMPK